MRLRRFKLAIERRGSVYLLGAILLALISLAVTLHFRHFSYDDAYITYRYAWNLAQGEGLVYNPGQSHLGITTPLYAILLAASSKLLPTLPIPESSGWLSGLFLLSCSLLTYLMVEGLEGPFVAAIAATLVVLNPALATTFGSEALLHLTLIMAAFYLYQKERVEISALFLALALLNRGDGAIPALILGAHYIYKQRRMPLAAMIIYLLAAVPWLAFAALTYGSLLPSTLSAKMAQGRSGLWLGFFTGLGGWFQSFIKGDFYAADYLYKGDLAFLLSLPLLILGLFYMLKGKRRWLLFFSWPALFTLGYALLGVSFSPWYAAPIALALSVLAALGVAAIQPRSRVLLPRKEGTKGWRSTFGFVGAVFALCLVLPIMGGEIRFLSAVAGQLPLPREEIYIRIGRWLAENTEPDASVAAIEVGYIGYYSGRRIIDLVGLVTPGVSEEVGKGDFVWGFLRFQPDYYVHNPRFGWLKVLLQRPWFQDSYVEVARFANDDYYKEPLVVYKKRKGANLPEPLLIDVAQNIHDRPADEIWGQTTIGQTFLCRKANLSGVELLLATYARENSQPVIFHLRTSPQATEDIATIEISSAGLIDNTWYLFPFPPMEGSSGGSYYFFLESPQSVPGDAITVWMSGRDIYSHGTFVRDHHLASGDLAFRVYYKP